MDSGQLDLNRGVDFERARERLARDAGAAFRHLQTLLDDGTQPREAIDAARAAAQEAQARVHQLTPDDVDGIRAVLQS